MPRRIELPSADELFGPARSGRAAPPAATSGAADAQAAGPLRARTPAPPRPAPPGRRARRSARGVGGAPAAHRPPDALERTEAGLATLSTDALIELRDSLEDMLASATVSYTDVEHALEVLHTP